MITEYVTDKFENLLKAYLLKNPAISNKQVRDANNLIFPHPLSAYKLMNKTYVPLIHQEHVEIV